MDFDGYCNLKYFKHGDGKMQNVIASKQLHFHVIQKIVFVVGIGIVICVQKL